MSIIRELIVSYRALHLMERIISEYVVCDMQDKEASCSTHVGLADGSCSLIDVLLEKFLEYRMKAKLFDELQNCKDQACQSSNDAPCK